MSNEIVESAWRVLQGVRPALPRRDNLKTEVADARAAQARGYYLPDEDERLRDAYLRYLAARATLWQMIHELEPHLKSKDLRIFGIAFCAASMLVRSAGYLIELAREYPVALTKLDEAEPRYQLPRKTLTRIYRSLSSPHAQWRYRQARDFYELYRTQIHEELEASDLGQLVLWLEREEPLFDERKRSLGRSLLEYGLYSLGRSAGSGYTKVMFHLFRLSGSAIAELKQPFIKARGSGKRVTARILEDISKRLKPGDILITRHDDAMSNLFLPGFWPHAALYIGRRDEREKLGLPATGDDAITVLEAKKDGVRFRELRETLSVDAFLILRPKVSPEELREALTRALSHEGKLFDFIFDFRKAERLACTEVVYRSFHGIGSWRLELLKKSGRLALSAEDLINQVLEKELVEVVYLYGVRGTSIESGEDASRTLRNTLPR